MNKDDDFLEGKPRWRGSLILLAVLSLPLLLLWGVVISEYFTCPKDINAEFDRVIAECRKNAPSQEEVDRVCTEMARKAAEIEIDLKEAIAKHPDFETSAEIRTKVFAEIAAKRDVTPSYVGHFWELIK